MSTAGNHRRTASIASERARASSSATSMTPDVKKPHPLSVSVSGSDFREEEVGAPRIQIMVDDKESSNGNTVLGPE
jgi:hypothetical protein